MALEMGHLSFNGDFDRKAIFFFYHGMWKRRLWKWAPLSIVETDVFFHRGPNMGNLGEGMFATVQWAVGYYWTAINRSRRLLY